MTEKPNPKAEEFCAACFLKDKCEKTILDQIYCKMNHMTSIMSKINQGLNK